MALASAAIVALPAAMTDGVRFMGGTERKRKLRAPEL